MRVTTANVHEFLKKMEAQSKPGMRVNDFVTLASAKASDRVFTIRYLVDAASLGVTAADFSRDDEVAEEKGMCRESNLQKLIKYGAVFERIYEDGAGNMLYRAKIDQNRCRMLK